VLGAFLSRAVILAQQAAATPVPTPDPSSAPAPGGLTNLVDTVSSVSSLGPLAGLSSGALVLLLGLSWKHVLIMPVKAYENEKAQWESTTEQDRLSAAREREAAEKDRVRERESLGREIEGLQKTNKDLTQFLFTEVIPDVTKVAGPLEALEKIQQATLDELRKRGQT
jgi:hypothetical protein